MKNYYFKSFLAACLLVTAGISASAQDFSSYYKVTYEGKTVENGGTITSSHWDEDNGWYECDIDFTPTGNFSNVEFEVTGNYTDYPSYQMQNRDPLTWGTPSICWSSGDEGNCVPNQPPLISNFTLNNTDPIQIQFHVIGEEGEAGPDFNPMDPSTWPENIKPANVSHYLLTFAAKVDGKAASNTFSINVLIGPVDAAVEGVMADDNTPVEYYDLQGRKVLNPAKGQLLIERKGAKAVKVIK